MDSFEIRQKVIKKYKVGQQLSICLKDNGREERLKTEITILRFNPSTVLTEHNGYKESFTYWDFLKMTVPKEIKESDLFYPSRISQKSIQTI